jgi:hypothetical protein
MMLYVKIILDNPFARIGSKRKFISRVKEITHGNFTSETLSSTKYISNVL